ncbi:MAG: mechanosensitive ion channel family protein, partial [Erythrobacter sp.]|nr:mechanosensitive ion channel family protein [Erythrobacter sp.]
RIIVPNSKIYTEPVTVITAYQILRSEYDVGIGYGDDVAEARRLALEAVQGVEGVMSDPAPDVLLWDLAGSSQNLRVRWWTDPTRGNVVKTKDRVLERVAGRLAEAGIDLPFPTNVVLLHDQTEAIDGNRRKQREGWPAGDNPPEPRPIGSVGGNGERSDQN